MHDRRRPGEQSLARDPDFIAEAQSRGETPGEKDRKSLREASQQREPHHLPLNLSPRSGVYFERQVVVVSQDITL